MYVIYLLAGCNETELAWAIQDDLGMCEKEVDKLHNILRQEHDDTDVQEVDVRDMTSLRANIVAEYNPGGTFEEPNWL